MNYYSYQELAAAALSANATQKDIDALGAWFEAYGSTYWNGEEYAIGNSHSLRPIYKQVDEDDFEITGYEVV